MSMTWRIVAICLPAAALSMVGACSEGGSGGTARPQRMTSPSKAVFIESTADQSYQAGVYAMRQWFPRLELTPEEGRIVAQAVEYDQRGGTERLRDVAGPRNRMRRRGMMVVSVAGSRGAQAECMIEVERLDTADHRTFYREHNRADDLPTETPIDRDAGLTAPQQEVWTLIARDRALEREILNVVRSRLAGAAPEAESPAPAGG